MTTTSKLSPGQQWLHHAPDLRPTPVFEIYKCEKSILLIRISELQTYRMHFWMAPVFCFWDTAQIPALLSWGILSPTPTPCAPPAPPAEKYCCVMCLCPQACVPSSTISCILAFPARPVINVKKLNVYFLFKERNPNSISNFGLHTFAIPIVPWSYCSPLLIDVLSIKGFNSHLLF